MAQNRRRASGKTSATSACAVVGVGASAGGLDALKRLCAQLPPDAPFALVIVQHLDPAQPSHLAQILDEACSLRVMRAEDGQKVEPGVVFVAPEGVEIRLSEDRVQLLPRPSDCGDVIDTFFLSLAENGGGHGCGVLLSGEGSDGAQGLREIRGAGGITLVQDPNTAEHAAMPLAAIESDAVDFIGSPEAIATELLLAVRHPRFGSPAPTSKAAKEREEHALSRIFAAIRTASGMDFSAYKPTTVMRRVGRRTMLRDVAGLDAYVQLLESDPGEVEALVDDMLINVTEFFRDPDVFDSLRTRVLPEVLAGKTEDDTLRIWVAGCSSGEEVYSVLITALEAIEDAGISCKIAVFGTDASEDAVRRARRGRYPVGICTGVSPERLARYFVPTADGYEVNRTLRDMCAFARQDITKDTPFSRLDIVTLRNVLIYMDQSLQKRVLDVMHFALAPGGFLVLGTSETPEGESRLFKTFDKAHHIYRRKNVAPRLPFDVTTAVPVDVDALSIPVSSLTPWEQPDLQAEANEMTLLLYGPPRVVIDAEGHVVHFFGDTSAYLEHPEGRATFDLLEIALPGLALELKEALDESVGSGGSVGREATFGSGRDKRRVSVEVTPLPPADGQERRLVAFRELPFEAGRFGKAATDNDLARLYESREDRLRTELSALRGRLRATSDEKNRANQGLMTANEEARSSNEELRSINEELETAKEELQSANEELITVNDELRQSNKDLGVANTDIENFMESTGIPVLMLDCDLNVRRYTPQAARVVHIAASDTGRPLSHLRFRVEAPDLEALALEVLSTRAEVSREVRDARGRWYSMQLRPYLSGDGDVDGVVVAFLDVDELKQSLERIRRRSELSRALNEIDVDIASTMEPEEILNRALDAGVRALGVDAGAIAVRDPDGWVVGAQVGFPSSDVGMRMSPDDARIAVRAAALRELIAVDDVTANDGVNAEFASKRGVRSIMAVPLIAREEAMGSLLLFSRTAPKTFTLAEKDFASRLGASVSLAVDNARLMEAERDAARRAQTLNAINEIIRSTLTPEELLGRLVGEVSEVAEAEKSLVIQVHDDSYTVTHVRNVRKDVLGVPRSHEFYPAFAKAARTQEPVLVEDTWSDPLTNKEFVVSHGLRAFQLLPLVVQSETEAVLALAWGERRTFDAEDQASSERFAVAMSIALSNARLYESEVEAQRQATQELESTQLLLDSAAALAELTEIQPMLDRLADVLLQSSAHSRVTIGLWDDERREITTVVSKGEPTIPLTTRPFKDISAPGRRMIRTKKPVLIDYAKVKDKGVQALIAQGRLRFALGVPVVARGRVLGTITVDAPGEHKAFTEREITLIKTIADQAATALENGRLFEAEVEAQLSANRELETTSQLLNSARSLAGWTDLSAVLDQLAKSVHVATGRQRVFVHRWDEHRPALVLTAAAGTGSAPMGSRYEWDKIAAPSRKVLTEKRTMILDYDRIRSVERKPYAGPMGFRVALAVPLVDRAMLVGLLIVDDPGERHDFEPREIELVEAIAAQASSAIRTAMSFEAEQAELAQATVLKEVAAAAASTLDECELSERVLAACRERLGAMAGSVYVIDSDAGNLRAAALFGFPESLTEQMNRMELDEERAAARSYLKDDVVMHDSPELPSGIAKRAKAAAATQNRWISLPIRARGEVLGSLGLIFEEQRAFEPEEIALYQSLASQLGVGVDKARLFEAEQEQLATTQALVDAAASVSTLDLDAVLERIVDIMAASLGRDRVVVHLVEREGEIRTVAARGARVLAIGQIQRLDDYSPELQAATLAGKPTVVDFRAEGLSELATKERERLQVEVVLYIPLQVQGRLLGVVTVDDAKKYVPFSDRDIELAVALASQAAVSIENARLYEAERVAREQAKQELETTSLLLDAATILAESSDLDSGLDRLVAAMRSAVPGVRAVVYGLVDATSELQVLAAGGGAAPAMGALLPLSGMTAAATDVLQTCQSAVIDFDRLPKKQRGLGEKFGVHRLMAVPAVFQDRALGIVVADDPSDPHREFSDREVEIFEAFAAQAAAAMQNARLFEAEQAARRAEAQRAERLEVLNVITGIATRTLERQKIGQHVVDDLARKFHLASSTIAVGDETQGILTPLAATGYPADDFLDAVPPFTLDSDYETVRVYRNGNPVIVRDIDAEETPEVSKAGLLALEKLTGNPSKAYLSLPLIAYGRTIGVLNVVWPSPQQFTDDDVAFFTSISHELAVGLENARLFEAEQAELARTTLLRRVAAAAAETLVTEELSERVLEACRELLGAKSGNVMVVDEPANVLRAKALFGFPKRRVPQMQEISLDTRTASVRSYLDGEIVTHEFAEASKEVSERARTAAVNENRWISLPIRARGEALGALGLAFEEKRRFTAQEIELYQSLADQLGVGLDKARLFEAESEARRQAQRELQTTELLLETAATLSRWTDVDSALERLAKVLLRSSSQRRVTVNLWDEDSRELRTVTSVGDQPMAPATFSADVLSPEIREAIASQTTLLFDYDELPKGETRQLAEERRIHLGLIVPIVFRGRTLGLVGVDSPGERREFSDREVELVEAVAAQASAAIRNAQLFEQVRENEARFRTLFGAMTEGFSLHEIIVDDAGKPCDYRYIEVNPAFEQQTGLKAADVPGKTLLELFPESETMWIERYGKVALTGEPDHFQAQFGPLDRWFEVSVYQTQPGRFAVVSYDITQRKAAEEMARASNERLTDTLTSMTDGFVSVDRRWRFTLVNPSAEKMLGRPAADTLGKSMKDLYPDMFGWPHYRKVMSKRTAETFEVWSKPLETWLEIHAYPTADGMSILFTDISERKRAESTAQARLRMLAAASATETTLDDVIRLVLDEMESLTASEIGFYHFVEPDQETLCLQNWSTRTLENMCTAEGKGRHYSISEAGVWVDAVKERRPVIHNDYEALPHKKGLPEGHAPVTRELVVPILRNDRTVAIIGVGNKSSNYQEADSETVAYLGDLSWEIVERKRAEETLASSRERADMLATLLEEAAQPFGVGSPSGELLLVNEAFEELTGYTADELREVSWATQLTPPEYLDYEANELAELARTGRPVRYEKEYLRKDGVRVPVELLVNVQMQDDGEVAYYYSFVTDLSARKQRERLDTGLNRIASSVSSTLDKHEVLSRLHEGVAEALRADAYALATLEAGHWVLEHVRGTSGDELAALLDAGRISPLAADDADQFAPILFDDVGGTESVAALAGLGVNRLLAIPLLAGGKVVGVLAVAQTRTDSPFTQAQIDFASRLMLLATIALENAELYERERTIADTLQEAILVPPAQIPGIESAYLYRPASAVANVGGDFYDVFELPDGRVGIVAGDVSGKGLEAARLTSILHDGARAYAYEVDDAGEVLTRLNLLVQRTSPPEAYATLFFGVLDVDTGKLRYCTAGHPSPIVVGREEIAPLASSRSPILGAFEDLRFHSAETILLPKEKLVMFTDGVTEARNAEGTFFGEEGVLAALATMRRVSLRRLPQRLVDAVLAYADGHLRDDTVVLAVMRTGAAKKGA